MLIDYNVSDDWPADEPFWMKSLVSSLDRRHGVTTVLPLPTATQEILDWLEFASGIDAWAKPTNRRSLVADLEQSRGALGPRVASHVSAEINALAAALRALGHAGRAGDGSVVLHQPPGRRNDPAWTAAETASRGLLAALAADEAIAACWQDLVGVARDRTLERREHRPIADLLFEQIRLRRHDPDEVFRHLVDTLVNGRSIRGLPGRPDADPPADRLAKAMTIVRDLPADEHVIVWLGYVGSRVDHTVAGNVTFMDAHWYVPNATSDRAEFAGKDELAQIVKWSMFSVAERVDEKSDVDLLARIDLGVTTVAGAAELAETIVDALLSLSVHQSHGVRPFLTQSAVIHDGTLGPMVTQTPQTAFANDTYGANMTASAIAEYAPRLGAAMATASLPLYLAAAVEAQSAADRPHSREMALRKPSGADIRSIIPLEDRVVQNVAAHAGMRPQDLFDRLTQLWPHSRWMYQVRTAVGTCLLGSGPKHKEIDNLRRELYGTNDSRPWLVFVADHERDLLDVCRVESDRGWVTRMLRSVSDPAGYRTLTSDYRREAEALSDRRARVRNAIVHGNPTSIAVVRSVADFAGFLSRYALEVGLDSFITGEGIETILNRDDAEPSTLRSGVPAVDYWRARAAAQQLAPTQVQPPVAF